uniref:Uncharacterized protein n=1 Tax=Rhizophora mucronata TaxID=61149 RepID=A0A2P2R0S2_RHIMU
MHVTISSCAHNYLHGCGNLLTVWVPLSLFGWLNV